MRRRRVSAGGARAWDEALAFLRAHVRSVLAATSVLLAGILVVNLYPGTPQWSAGFATGFLAATLLGFVWWMAWVPSGLASRSMGLVAEQWSSELLRKSPGVWAVIPSLKFAHKDVDHVVIAAAGVVAVETKWTAHAPTRAGLERAADQAADAGRTLRLSLRRDDLPVGLFSNAVLYWGPGGNAVLPVTVKTVHGPVTVLSGNDAGPWLATLRTGPVGRDYAEKLRRELVTVAVQRDRDAIKFGRLARWLAKAK